MHEIVFRVDASQTIGTGHVMRCLVLANELRGQGGRPVFICRAHPGHLATKIREAGHEVLLLPMAEAVQQADQVRQNEYAAWLGADWRTDAAETVQALNGHQPSWLVVDHFAIDARWEKQVRADLNAKIMVIDGMANRPHDCDLLLDQSFSSAGPARWEGLLPASCRRFVGPRFALLRPEFIRAQQALRQRDGAVRRIFVAFGGVDQPNATQVAIDAIVALHRPDLHVDVVLGAGNPHIAALERRFHELGNVHLLVQPDHIAALMAAADLAISSGGTFLLEQCFMQLPAMVVSIAANQINQARALSDAGAAVYIGHLDTENPAAIQAPIQKTLAELIADPGRVLHMQAAASQLMVRPEESISQVLRH